jgi:hypothetical protein
MSTEEGSTALEIEADEENIQKIHERRSLLGEGRKKVKSPSCRAMFCKAIVLGIAGVLFILMMVELWGDYGNVINTKTLFNPRVFSVTETCPPGAESTAQLQEGYNPLDCTWDITETSSDIHCNAKSMPTNPMVLPSYTPGQNKLEINDNHMHLSWDDKNISTCVRLLIYSI